MELKGYEDKFLKMGCQATQLQLRLRGTPDSFPEGKQEMVDLLAEYLENEPEELKFQIDTTYTINSEYARQKNLPRDVMVHFMTKSLREEVIRR